MTTPSQLDEYLSAMCSCEPESGFRCVPCRGLDELDALRKDIDAGLRERDAATAALSDVTSRLEKADKNIREDVRQAYEADRVALVAKANEALDQRDAARFRPMGDNHHNAVACPYCNPKREVLVPAESVQYAELMAGLLREVVHLELGDGYQGSTPEQAELMTRVRAALEKGAPHAI